MKRESLIYCVRSWRLSGPVAESKRGNYYRLMEECYNSIQADTDLHVTYTGSEVCKPLHEYHARRDHFILHYIVRGEGTLKINSNT